MLLVYFFFLSFFQLFFIVFIVGFCRRADSHNSKRIGWTRSTMRRNGEGKSKQNGYYTLQSYRTHAHTRWHKKIRSNKMVPFRIPFFHFLQCFVIAIERVMQELLTISFMLVSFIDLFLRTKIEIFFHLRKAKEKLWKIRTILT